MIDPIYIHYTGTALAIFGSIISVIGASYNNLFHNHLAAMKLWMVSNILLLTWAIGYTFGIWDGSISGMALIGMYLVFAATNAYGLLLYRAG